MGCKHSVEEDINETHVESGILTIFGKKYVVPPGKPMVLYLKPQFWGNVYSGDYFEVVDVNSGAGSIVFKLENSSASNRNSIVLNENNEAVFYLDGKSFSLDGTKIIKRNGCEMFRIATNFSKTKQRGIGLFNLSGEKVKCRGKLDMLSLKGSMWYGTKGSEVCIAKICSPIEAMRIVGKGIILDQNPDAYYIVIPPGVDTALVFAFILTSELTAHLSFTM